MLGWFYNFFSTSIEPIIKEQEQKPREQAPRGSKRKHATFGCRLWKRWSRHQLLKKKLLDAIKIVKQLNGRMMLLTLASYGLDVVTATAYAPQSNFVTEVKKKNNLWQPLKWNYVCSWAILCRWGFQCQSSLCEVNQYGRLWSHILGTGMEYYLNRMNEKKKESSALSLRFCSRHIPRICSHKSPICRKN